MGNASEEPVLVPVGRIGGKLDNDDPNYVFAPDLYMALALAYDSLAAPAARQDRQGVFQADYEAMQPRLAASWEEQENGDWIVRLKPGILSHAGNELVADDIVWTYAKIAAQGVMASWRWREVVGVESVEAVDRHTVRYRLRRPYPTFPNWLLSVSPNMVDSTAIEDSKGTSDPWGIGWLNRNVAGFGPFDLTAMDDWHLKFAPRKDYWMGAPGTRAVEVRLVADRREALAQLDENRPVLLAGLDPDETVALLARDDLTVLRTWAGHVSVEIDFTEPPFDDLRVRHALALATPVERIIRDGLLGQARPWRSPVKGISQWYSADGWDFAFDLDRARRLLAEAGHGTGFKSDFFLHRHADSQRIAAIIQEAWKEIGIELTLRDVAGTSEGWLPPLFLRTECAHNLSEPIYDLAHDYAAMNPLRPLPGGPPHVGNWRPRWIKNPEAIKRFVALLDEPDSRRKRALFDDYQRWLIHFSSSIFIAEGQQVMAANRHVPPSLIAPESRLYQALNHQNCTTNYLPPR
jgi:peptide/nickel transport system substrate-binding protein